MRVVFVALALLLTTVPLDTALIARGLSTADVSRARVRCAAHFACADAVDVDAAVADASSLGLVCSTDDDVCWQRFLAAEGFVRVLVVDQEGEVFRVRVVTWEGTRLVSGTALEGALDAAAREGDDGDHENGTRAKATSSPVATTPVSAVAPPAATPGSPQAGATDPVDGVRTPFLVAGLAGAVAMASAVSAVVVSVDLARSLERAQARIEPLTGYTERNALFFALATTAALATAATTGSLIIATLGPPP